MDQDNQQVENKTLNESERFSASVSPHEELNMTESTLLMENNEIVELPEWKYAGFWMRFWAYLADLVIIGSINRILIYPVLRVLDIPLHDGGIFSTVNICTAVIFYLYFVLMTKYFKQTLGKMIFGLKVVALQKDKLTWSTILFREWIGRFISGSILLLYVIIAFLPKKQGLHDLFADTTVIYDR